MHILLVVQARADGAYSLQGGRPGIKLLPVLGQQALPNAQQPGPLLQLGLQCADDARGETNQSLR
jgi:hypothetical protein